MEFQENAVEWYTGMHYITVSLTDRPMIRKMKKLYEAHPEEFKYFKENMDGSVCCKCPSKWLRIKPPAKRDLTDEQRQAARDRLAKARCKE